MSKYINSSILLYVHVRTEATNNEGNFTNQIYKLLKTSLRVVTRVCINIVHILLYTNVHYQHYWSHVPSEHVLNWFNVSNAILFGISSRIGSHWVSHLGLIFILVPAGTNRFIRHDVWFIVTVTYWPMSPVSRHTRWVINCISSITQSTDLLELRTVAEMSSI